ncbi:MAG: Uma2 family endonuclease [Lachnospiraceae bacterium]|nr:Uma2 family endonuclease [Lachnospiraceae bacterium]
MAFAQGKVYTLEDIYNLPEGQRAELIDGKIYYMAPPSRIHQDISMFLSKTISNYIDYKSDSCKVYAAPFAVFLNEDDNNYLEPDLSIICTPSKLDDKGCHGAPDWIIEITSPGTKQMDYGIKLFKYRTARVREYWIVDPKQKRIMIWNFEHNTMEEYTFFDTVAAGICDDLIIDFSKLKL